jgi:hypothetical protein
MSRKIGQFFIQGFWILVMTFALIFLAGIIGSPTNVSAHIATEPANINAGAVGPSGIAVDASGTMYWADTLANEIFKVPNVSVCSRPPLSLRAPDFQ